MNVAANPRLGAAANPGGAGDVANAGAGAGGEARVEVQGGIGAERVAALVTSGPDAAGNGTDPVEARLDRRTRPQKLLDGLVGGCRAALASGHLSAAGGLRPQIMATINYRDLLEAPAPANPRRSNPDQSTQANQPQATQFWAGGPWANGLPAPQLTAPQLTARELTARELTARAGPDPCCSPARSRRRPYARSPATPTSSRSCSAARAGFWTSAGPHGSFRRTSARPSRPGTRGVHSRNAPSPRRGAKPTMSRTGPGAAAPEQRTERCCVRTTII